MHALYALKGLGALRPELDPDLRAQLGRYGQAVRAARPGEPVRTAFINTAGRLIELAGDDNAP